MRCWYWKIPRNSACGCRCHMSDNVWAEAYFRFNTGMPTPAPTGPQFELSNERNKPSCRLGFEVLLKSLRFSPCGPLSAALNKRGFVGSTVGALGKLVGQVRLCWVPGGDDPVWYKPTFFNVTYRHMQMEMPALNLKEADLFQAKHWCEQQQLPGEDRSRGVCLKSSSIKSCACCKVTKIRRCELPLRGPFIETSSLTDTNTHNTTHILVNTLFQIECLGFFFYF